MREGSHGAFFRGLGASMVGASCASYPACEKSHQHLLTREKAGVQSFSPCVSLQNFRRAWMRGLLLRPIPWTVGG